MVLSEFYVQDPDEEIRQIIADTRGVPLEDVPTEEAVRIRDFGDRALAHDFAEEHDGRVFARRDIREEQPTDGTGVLWFYVPVWLPYRPAHTPE